MEDLSTHYEHLLELSAQVTNEIAKPSIDKVRKTQYMMLQQSLDMAMAVIAITAGEDGIRL